MHERLRTSPSRPLQTACGNLVPHTGGVFAKVDPAIAERQVAMAARRAIARTFELMHKLGAKGSWLAFTYVDRRAIDVRDRERSAAADGAGRGGVSARPAGDAACRAGRSGQRAELRHKRRQRWRGRLAGRQHRRRRPGARHRTQRRRAAGRAARAADRRGSPCRDRLRAGFRAGFRPGRQTSKSTRK